MNLKCLIRSCIAVTLVAANAALANDSLSSSNDPTARLDGRVSAVLVTEKRALGSVSEKRLRQLVSSQPMARTLDPVTAVTYSNAWLDKQPLAKGAAEWQCLAEALYFEARGESVKGQFAVAEVILNRVTSPRFPASVCGVIHQGTGRKHQCQFSYTCDGHAENIRELRAYERVGKIARLMLDGAPKQLTQGATYYHSASVLPRWAKVFSRTAKIGVHYFYRPKAKS
jgi:spore germination cell wall hydrolase CwlJ-like protein